MKLEKILSAIGLGICLAIPGVAQAYEPTVEPAPEGYEYMPMLEQGKTWRLWHGGHWFDAFTLNETSITHRWLVITVDGEEVVEGQQCKVLKISYENVNDSHDSCEICSRYDLIPDSKLYAYEEGSRLYIQRNPGPYYDIPEDMDPMDWFQQDFLTVSYGDPRFEMYIDFDFSNYDVSYEDFNGVTRRVFSRNSLHPVGLFDGVVKYIEGIGSPAHQPVWNEYPTINVVAGNGVFHRMYYLATVEKNGAILYDARKMMLQHKIEVPGYTPSDNSLYTGVESIEDADNLNADDTLYNLQGNPVENPKKGEIYIRSGKKIIY